MPILTVNCGDNILVTKIQVEISEKMTGERFVCL